MLNIVLICLVIVVLLLIGLVMIQKSDGGGLVSSNNAGSMLSVRGTTTFLTRATAVLAGLFFFLCILTAILTKKEAKIYRDALSVDKVKNTLKKVAKDKSSSDLKKQPIGQDDKKTSMQKTSMPATVDKKLNKEKQAKPVQKAKKVKAIIPIKAAKDSS